MKIHTKQVYFVIDETTGKEQYKEDKNSAEETKQFLSEIIPDHSFRIEQREIEEKEIEKGDKIHWLHNGKIDTNRTDIVTAIKKNAWGDIIYRTKEINGSRTGEAYPQYIVLVQAETN
jgi:hypothetical protein